jgi:hypothetical protein
MVWAPLSKPGKAIELVADGAEACGSADACSATLNSSNDGRTKPPTKLRTIELENVFTMLGYP